MGNTVAFKPDFVSRFLNVLTYKPLTVKLINFGHKAPASNSLVFGSSLDHATSKHHRSSLRSRSVAYVRLFSQRCDMRRDIRVDLAYQWRRKPAHWDIIRVQNFAGIDVFPVTIKGIWIRQETIGS